jgi:hypothetical protein
MSSVASIGSKFNHILGYKLVTSSSYNKLLFLMGNLYIDQGFSNGFHKIGYLLIEAYLFSFYSSPPRMISAYQLGFLGNLTTFLQQV